jgi:hypothetical protein
MSPRFLNISILRISFQDSSNLVSYWNVLYYDFSLYCSKISRNEENFWNKNTKKFQPPPSKDQQSLNFPAADDDQGVGLYPYRYFVNLRTRESTVDERYLLISISKSSNYFWRNSQKKQIPS